MRYSRVSLAPAGFGQALPSVTREFFGSVISTIEFSGPNRPKLIPFAGALAFQQVAVVGQHLGYRLFPLFLCALAFFGAGMMVVLNTPWTSAPCRRSRCSSCRCAPGDSRS